MYPKLRGAIDPIYTLLYYSTFHFLFHYPYISPIKSYTLSTYLRGTMACLLRPSLAQDAMDDPGHVDHLWLTKVYRKTAVHIGVILG